MSAVDPREKRLAEAVAILVDAIHHDVPAASMRPLPPYDDEDFTLEVRMPAGTGPERSRLHGRRFSPRSPPASAPPTS